MGTINSGKFRLKGHGSFTIREGWIHKGLTAVNENPSLFRKKKIEDIKDVLANRTSADILGVGSNMAQAIRYWLKVCGLMEENTTHGAKLSNIGKLILAYDPYIEDIFTLWIMHCNLVMDNEGATSWFLFFNMCEAEEYTRDEIFNQMKSELEIYSMESEFSEKSLADDVAAITNMYAKTEEQDPEDSMVCPFTRLKLLEEKDHRYTKTQPDLSMVDERVILYILMKQMGAQNSISIDSLVEDVNSIGKILNMGRVTINQYLDKLEKDGFIRVNRTSGLDVVYKEFIKTAQDVVVDYYNNEMN